MRIFGRVPKQTSAGPNLLRLLASGARPPELVHEAVRVLLAETEADRAGVWMEWAEGVIEEETNTPMFRGFVMERSGDATPAEWKKLSMEAPLIREVISRREVMLLQLDGSLDGLSMGALLELRGVVCAAVQTEGRMRGIVLAGTRNKQVTLDKMMVERVATELAIVAQVEDERRRARERQEDAMTARRILEQFGSGESAEAVLAALAENCTNASKAENGPSAIFAVIGETSSPQQRDGPPSEDVEQERIPPRIQASWRSGDGSWTNAIDRDPLLGLWRRALESRRVAGGEPESGVREVGRMVAFPLEGGGEPIGVLIAGMSASHTSLATLERLELRAALAAQALLQRKRNREAEQQRKWEKALLEGTEDALFLLDAHGRIQKLSQKARSLESGGKPFGSMAACEPVQFADLFEANERSEIVTWLKQSGTARGWQPAKRERLDYELANGRKVRLQGMAAAGEEISAVVLKPVPASKAEEKEHRAQTELRNVIEWLDEGVVLFDERQEVRAMNSRFAQMTGLTAEESTRTQSLHGLAARLANQTAEPEKFAAAWLGMARGSESGVRDELHLLLPTPRVLERAARPVLDRKGTRLGRIEIYRDLTAQRVFHSKLMQTEKLAALGQMVTSIAHELSNPLTSILGYAQRLAARSRASGAWQDAQQIVDEAERASTILKQLLLTAPNSRPERRKVLLNEIVKRTLELQNAGLCAEKIKVELDLDARLPFVLGEAGQLQQVLMNLIGNARQAIQETGQPGTILVRTTPAGGTHALLEVSDNGPGIPQAIVAKVFDPFFTTKPAGVGTGLGLSIVLGIVREHGGQVRVSSSPGGGATFSIELPAVPSDGSQNLPRITEAQRENADEWRSEEAASDGPQLEGMLGAWAGCRVLVVEDEATVAQLIADVLKDEGLEVEVLLDGREALRRASSEDYDLVICDMKMPDLDGEQFYRRLAKTENPLSRRVLFVTGDVLASHTRQFLQRNALAHLAKPFRVEELVEKVREVWMEINPRKIRETKSKVARN
jgi:signal transduction histidine kinase/AmiR/NasT family two-component response regulator